MEHQAHTANAMSPRAGAFEANANRGDEPNNRHRGKSDSRNRPLVGRESSRILRRQLESTGRHQHLPRPCRELDHGGTRHGQPIVSPWQEWQQFAQCDERGCRNDENGVLHAKLPRSKRFRPVCAAAAGVTATGL